MIRVFEILIAVTTWLAIKGWRFLVCLLLALAIHQLLEALIVSELTTTTVDIPLGISAILVASVWQIRSRSFHSNGTD